MGYRVHRENDTYKVVEVVEGEVRDIMANMNEVAAKDMSKTLNSGGGFDGWTPNFFLQPLKKAV